MDKINPINMNTLPTISKEEIEKNKKRVLDNLKERDLPIITGELPPEEKPRFPRRGEIIKLHGLLYDVMFVNRNTGHVRMKLKKERI